MSDSKNVQIGKHSDAGKVRELNEDSFATPGTQKINTKDWVQRGTLVAVADGMGGHAAGEVASKMAVETLFKVFYGGRELNPSKALATGFETANKEIHAVASSDPAKSSMGTTLVAAAVKNGTLYVANVGDSRAYLVRGKRIRQITRDHSWVAEQLRAHVLTEEQAKQHVYKNIITRAIGNRPEVKADIFREGLKSKDAIVLCSDGLSNKVEPSEIREIVSIVPEPDQAAQRLVQLANQRGGEDNITAIVIRVPSVPTMWPFVIASSVLLCILIVVAYVAFVPLPQQTNPGIVPLAPTPTVSPAPTEIGLFILRVVVPAV